jgi:hypothetical protein
VAHRYIVYVVDSSNIFSPMDLHLPGFVEAYRFGKKVMKKSLTRAVAYQYKQLAQKIFVVAK